MKIRFYFASDVLVKGPGIEQRRAWRAQADSFSGRKIGVGVAGPIPGFN